jgi:hypothetical protein
MIAVRTGANRAATATEEPGGSKAGSPRRVLSEDDPALIHDRK